MTEEHKQLIKEGREKARKEKLALGIPLRQSRKNSIKTNYINDKPVVIITGKEKTGFDFWTPLRKSLRPMHLYDLCKKLERLIVNPTYYQNVSWIKDNLSTYVYLQEKEEEQIVKKIRKKTNYIMTEEHKQKIKEGRMKKKNGN